MRENQLSGLEEYTLLKEVDETTDFEVNETGVYDFDKLPLSTLVEGKPIDNPSTPLEKTKKYKLLKKLDQEKIITLITPVVKDYFEIAVYDNQKLYKRLLMAKLRTMHDDGEPAFITYSSHSGKGTLNGKPFRLKGKNKQIFTMLVNNVNKPLDKGKVWRAGGRKGKPKYNDETITLNSYITNLRRALGGISPTQLRQKKTVELWAYVNLTDEYDLNTVLLNFKNIMFTP